jgi:hypothetical protein
MAATMTAVEELSEKLAAVKCELDEARSMIDELEDGDAEEDRSDCIAYWLEGLAVTSGPQLAPVLRELARRVRNDDLREGGLV